MDKKAKLLDIITQLQELYPELNRLMIDDVDDPNSIIITSEERIDELAQEEGIDELAQEEGIDIEIVEDFFEESDEKQLILEYDDDDDNGGGFLQ